MRSRFVRSGKGKGPLEALQAVKPTSNSFLVWLHELLVAKVETVFDLFTDYSPLKSFDSDAFLTYTIWSAVLSTTRFLAMENAASADGALVLTHIFTARTAFVLLYLVLLPLAVAVAFVGVEHGYLKLRAYVLWLLFAFVGFLFGYIHPENTMKAHHDLYLPIVSTMVFFLFADALGNDRPTLLAVSLAAPSIVSFYAAVMYDELRPGYYCSLVEHLVLSFMCLQSGVRTFSPKGAHNRWAIYQMVVRFAVVSEYIGMANLLR